MSEVKVAVKVKSKYTVVHNEPKEPKVVQDEKLKPKNDK